MIFGKLMYPLLLGLLHSPILNFLLNNGILKPNYKNLFQIIHEQIIEQIVFLILVFFNDFEIQEFLFGEFEQGFIGGGVELDPDVEEFLFYAGTHAEGAKKELLRDFGKGSKGKQGEYGLQLEIIGIREKGEIWVIRR